MTNASNGLRALLTYILIVPVALILGYVLSNPLDYSTFATVGIVAGVMTFPLLMKWHHPLLLLTWNMGGAVIFIKGQPEFWMIMVALSLGMAVLQRTLIRESSFVLVPRIVLPLLAIVAVALITAQMTGGFGLRSFGGEVYGGKKYISLIGAVLAYFALTSCQIPKERAALAIGLFFLGGLGRAIGDLYHFAPRWMEPLFWIFQPQRGIEGDWELVIRLVGVTSAGVGLFSFLLAHYGLGGIFLSRKWWRILFLLLAVGMAASGGFRSALLVVATMFTFQFFLEGMHRTRLLPIAIFMGILGFVLLIPLASTLPFGFQRTLAILPLPVDPVARRDAEHSTKWRLDLWAAVLPEVPKHLLLGKGYALSVRDFAMAGSTATRSVDAGQQDLALSGDYHNGPLSVILPFGIWGVIAFLWFMWAAARVLYANYRYGDPELHRINTFLWASFLTYSVRFFFIAGGMHSDMLTFVGLVGLSVALNGGQAKKPEVSPAAAPAINQRLRPRLGFGLAR